MPTACEELLEDLIEDLERRASDQKLGYGQLGEEHRPPGNVEHAWQKCSELVDKYDKGLCAAYREQIDTLLVFAGLFSAVVTAFTIESYKWLHDDTGDVSVQLLSQIASILSKNSTHQSVLSENASHPAVPSTSALSDAAAARINAFWFLSLVLSLSAALVAILSKQWVQEYDRDAGRTHPDALAVRQLKFDGLGAWKVSEIVSSVPVLLQIALAFFFLGLTELLFRLKPVVAAPATSVIILVGLFYMVTTYLPAIQLVRWYLTPGRGPSQCPYKSPQAWWILRVTVQIITTLYPRKRAYASSLMIAYAGFSNTMDSALAMLMSARSWINFDLACTALSDAEGILETPEYRFAALAWLKQNVVHSELPIWIWHCLYDSSLRKNLRPRMCATIRACSLSSQRRNYDLPPMVQPDPHMQACSVLFLYSVEHPIPTSTALELLFRIISGFPERFRDGPGILWVLRCITAVKIKVQGTDDTFPPDVCDFLISYIWDIALQPTGPGGAHGQHFLHLLSEAQGVISHCRPPKHRAKLHAIICALSHQCLKAANFSGLDHEHQRYILMACYESLRRSFDACVVTPLSMSPAESRTCYSREIIILSKLAEAIDIAWNVSLCKNRPEDEWFQSISSRWQEGDFNRLLQIAGDRDVVEREQFDRPCSRVVELFPCHQQGPAPPSLLRRLYTQR